jgi:hypothetical protein
MQQNAVKRRWSELTANLFRSMLRMTVLGHDGVASVHSKRMSLDKAVEMAQSIEPENTTYLFHETPQVLEVFPSFAIGSEWLHFAGLDKTNDFLPLRMIIDAHADAADDTTLIGLTVVERRHGSPHGLVRLSTYHMELSTRSNKRKHYARRIYSLLDDLHLRKMLGSSEGIVYHRRVVAPESYSTMSVINWGSVWNTALTDYIFYRQTIHPAILAALEKSLVSHPCSASAEPLRILELCGGDGALAAEILSRYSSTQYVLVEKDAILAEAAHIQLRRFPKAASTQVIAADVYDVDRYLPAVIDTATAPHVIIMSGGVWTTSVGFDGESALAHFATVSQRAAPSTLLIVTGHSLPWMTPSDFTKQGWTLCSTLAPGVFLPPKRNTHEDAYMLDAFVEDDDDDENERCVISYLPLYVATRNTPQKRA